MRGEQLRIARDEDDVSVSRQRPETLVGLRVTVLEDRRFGPKPAELLVRDRADVLIDVIDVDVGERVDHEHLFPDENVF
jgi:hypothetical protein